MFQSKSLLRHTQAVVPWPKRTLTSSIKVKGDYNTLLGGSPSGIKKRVKPSRSIKTVNNDENLGKARKVWKEACTTFRTANCVRHDLKDCIFEPRIVVNESNPDIFLRFGLSDQGDNESISQTNEEEDSSNRGIFNVVKNTTIFPTLFGIESFSSGYYTQLRLLHTSKLNRKAVKNLYSHAIPSMKDPRKSRNKLQCSRNFSSSFNKEQLKTVVDTEKVCAHENRDKSRFFTKNSSVKRVLLRDEDSMNKDQNELTELEEPLKMNNVIQYFKKNMNYSNSWNQQALNDDNENIEHVVESESLGKDEVSEAKEDDAFLESESYVITAVETDQVSSSEGEQLVILTEIHEEQTHIRSNKGYVLIDGLIAKFDKDMSHLINNQIGLEGVDESLRLEATTDPVGDSSETVNEVKEPKDLRDNGSNEQEIEPIEKLRDIATKMKLREVTENEQIEKLKAAALNLIDNEGKEKITKMKKEDNENHKNERTSKAAVKLKLKEAKERLRNNSFFDEKSSIDLEKGDPRIKEDKSQTKETKKKNRAKESIMSSQEVQHSTIEEDKDLEKMMSIAGSGHPKLDSKDVLNNILRKTSKFGVETLVKSVRNSVKAIIDQNNEDLRIESKEISEEHKIMNVIKTEPVCTSEVSPKEDQEIHRKTVSRTENVEVQDCRKELEDLQKTLRNYRDRKIASNLNSGKVDENMKSTKEIQQKAKIPDNVQEIKEEISNGNIPESIEADQESSRTSEKNIPYEYKSKLTGITQLSNKFRNEHVEPKSTKIVNDSKEDKAEMNKLSQEGMKLLLMGKQFHRKGNFVGRTNQDSEASGEDVNTDSTKKRFISYLRSRNLLKKNVASLNKAIETSIQGAEFDEVDTGSAVILDKKVLTMPKIHCKTLEKSEKERPGHITDLKIKSSSNTVFNEEHQKEDSLSDPWVVDLPWDHPAPLRSSLSQSNGESLKLRKSGINIEQGKVLKKSVDVKEVGLMCPLKMNRSLQPFREVEKSISTIEQKPEDVPRLLEYKDIKVQGAVIKNDKDNPSKKFVALLSEFAEEQGFSVTDRLMKVAKGYSKEDVLSKRHEVYKSKVNKDTDSFESLVTNCMIEAATNCDLLDYPIELLDAKIQASIIENVFEKTNGGLITKKSKESQGLDSLKASSEESKKLELDEGNYINHLKRPVEPSVSKFLNESSGSTTCETMEDACTFRESEPPSEMTNFAEPEYQKTEQVKKDFYSFGKEKVQHCTSGMQRRNYSTFPQRNQLEEIRIPRNHSHRSSSTNKSRTRRSQANTEEVLEDRLKISKHHSAPVLPDEQLPVNHITVQSECSIGYLQVRKTHRFHVKDNLSSLNTYSDRTVKYALSDYPKYSKETHVFYRRTSVESDRRRKSKPGSKTSSADRSSYMKTNLLSGISVQNLQSRRFSSDSKNKSTGFINSEKSGVTSVELQNESLKRTNKTTDLRKNTENSLAQPFVFVKEDPIEKADALAQPLILDRKASFWSSDKSETTNMFPKESNVNKDPPKIVKYTKFIEDSDEPLILVEINRPEKDETKLEKKISDVKSEVEKKLVKKKSRMTIKDLANMSTEQPVSKEKPPVVESKSTHSVEEVAKRNAEKEVLMLVTKTPSGRNFETPADSKSNYNPNLGQSGKMDPVSFSGSEKPQEVFTKTPTKVESAKKVDKKLDNAKVVTSKIGVVIQDVMKSRESMLKPGQSIQVKTLETVKVGSTEKLSKVDSKNEVRSNKSVEIGKDGEVKLQSVKILDELNAHRKSSTKIEVYNDIKSGSKLKLDKLENNKVMEDDELNKLLNKKTSLGKIESQPLYDYKSKSFSEYLVNVRRNSVKMRINEKNYPIRNEEKGNLPYPKSLDFVVLSYGEELLERIFTYTPSVSKILDKTLSHSSKTALHIWKKKFVGQLGVIGFEKKHKEFLKYQVDFNISLKKHILGMPLYSFNKEPGPVQKALRSVQNVTKELASTIIMNGPVVHYKLPYHGVIDCVARYKGEPVLIEWKLAEKRSGALSSTFDAPVQMAAYLGAFNFDKRHNFHVTSGLIVVAYSDGSPADALEVTPSDCEDYWKEWLKRLDAYLIMESNEFSKSTLK